MQTELINKNICDAVASEIPKISVYVDSLTHEEKAKMTSEALDVNAEISDGNPHLFFFFVLFIIIALY